MNLATKHCAPCEKNTPKMRYHDAMRKLGEVPNWNIADDGSWIEREFKFSNFSEALDFVNRVGHMAEAEGHHPDICFGYGYCKVMVQTHAIGGLSENDFIIAAKVNEIAEV